MSGRPLLDKIKAWVETEMPRAKAAAESARVAQAEEEAKRTEYRIRSEYRELIDLADGERRFLL